MRVWDLFKRNYLDWDEYLRRMEEAEWIMFIDQTAQESLRNICSKEVENGA